MHHSPPYSTLYTSHIAFADIPSFLHWKKKTYSFLKLTLTFSVQPFWHRINEDYYGSIHEGQAFHPVHHMHNPLFIPIQAGISQPPHFFSLCGLYVGTRSISFNMYVCVGGGGAGKVVTFSTSFQITVIKHAV